MDLEEIKNTLGGRLLSDGTVMVRCPAHDDNTPSLHITPADDGCILVNCQAGCGQDAVIEALKARDLWPNKNGHKSSTANLPPGIPNKWYGAEYATHWTYYDQQGKALGHVARYEGPDGKQVIPFFKQNGSKWKSGATPEPRPLYNLHLLSRNPDKPVLIAEGEKATDAAQRLSPDYVCTTWPNGSNAPGKADFKPLAGRDVIIWPDADEPGHKAAFIVADRCRKAGARSVVMVRPPENVKTGWDLADAEAEGWTGGKIRELIEAEREEEKNKFQARIITGQELHAHFLKTLSQTWRVDNVLPEASFLNVIYGPPGTYKSFIAQDMGLSISAGIEWHGHSVKRVPVVYIAAEGQAGALKRIEAWKRYRGVDVIGNFSLIPAPCLLDDTNDLDALIATMNELPETPGLIVIDTLARCMSGDENSTADMGQIVISCGKITQKTGAQVLIVHHTGKDATRGARGSIALTGATDTLLATQKNDEKQAVLICERQKDFEPFESMFFRLEKADTGFVTTDMEPVMSLIPVLDPDARPQQGKVKLSGSKRIAYEALQGLYTDNVMVHIDHWRVAAYKAGISASSDQAAKQKAFKRAVTNLMDMGFVDCSDEYYKPSK